MRPLVGSLPVQFRRIVSDGKKDLQQPAVADDPRVVDDPHRLGVPGAARADQLVIGIFFTASAYPDTALVTPVTC